MSSNGLFGLVGTVEIAVVGVNEDGRQNSIGKTYMCFEIAHHGMYTVTNVIVEYVAIFEEHQKMVLDP